MSDTGIASREFMPGRKDSDTVEKNGKKTNFIFLRALAFWRLGADVEKRAAIGRKGG